MNPTQAHRLAAIATAFPADTLVLRSFSGEEKLSRPFKYVAELSSKDASIDFNLVVGRQARIELDLGRAGTRYFHGIVSRFVQVPGDVGGARYQAEIVPWLWLLTRTTDCRIYQGKSVVEIVEDVFHRFGFSDYILRLSRNYRKIEYCVQYRETAFDFVNRLLEMEGITYFFTHAADRHHLVVADSPAGHGPVPHYEKIRWHPLQHPEAIPEKIRHWSVEKQLQPASYVHSEYNFTKPRADLQAAARFPEVVPGHDWEIFDYPGEYDHLGDGETYARLRAEELGAAQDVHSGQTDAMGLAAGHVFELHDHPRHDQNMGYLVTGTHIDFDQSAYVTGDGDGGTSYQCDFTCVPGKRQFRPARITRKPVVHGEQTAVVVGPAGKEIHVDDHARVKVHFFWDRHNRHDDSASCWLRVSQPWAGKGYGGMNIPRVGCEVIVSFLEGDPDRPIITGRVYNAGTMPHASNAGRDGKPGNTKPSGIAAAAMMTSFKSNSLGGSGGHNEITMNDAGGAETMFIKAQKDEIHNVGNDREDTVGNDETRKVGNDRKRDVGNNESVNVGVNRSMTVGSNHTEKIGSNQSINVGANKSETVGVAATETIGLVKALTIGVGYQVTVGASMNTSVALTQTEQVGLIKHTIVGSKYTIEVGSASITLESGGKVTIKGTEFDFSSSGPVKINGSVIDLN